MSTPPSASEAAPAAAPAPAPSLILGGIIFAGIVVALFGFIALGSVLALTPLYTGFLLIWYWANVGGLQLKTMPTAVAGALAGIGTAWLLQLGMQTANQPIGWVALALILLALFCSIMQWLSWIVNGAFMLFLTIGAAPLIQTGERFAAVAAAILLAAAYTAILVLLGQAIANRRTRTAQPVAMPEA